VVVVSINHRLNLLGFLNLQKYGDQFKHSGNVGMLDAVQALEWVKKNIVNFGGNPDSVMIFGQSGGGGKVAYLMAMPSAKGLFHRAIIESGSQPWNNSTAVSSAVAEAVLDELQLRPDQAGELQMMPYSKLSAAASAVMLRMAPPPSPNLLRRPGHAGWSPVTDGEIIPETPFYPKAPALSAHIPLMIGSTLNEFINATNHPEVEKMTEAELLSRVEASLPGKGAEAIAIYRKADPTATPYDLWSEMNATTGMRHNAVEIAKRHASQGAPVYNYEFRWQTPVLNGRPRAFHCSEITFAFDNTDRCDSMTGGGEDARALAAKCSEAWLHFAKTGDPNHPGLPKWDTVAGDRIPTMFLDNHCKLMIDPDDNQLRITA
jgi:para-nitrobenzyl esterase